MQMEVKKLHCKRCGYSWYPKIIDGKTQKPGTCAKCRSKYWDLPVVRHSVSEARKK